MHTFALEWTPDADGAPQARVLGWFRGCGRGAGAGALHTCVLQGSPDTGGRSCVSCPLGWVAVELRVGAVCCATGMCAAGASPDAASALACVRLPLRHPDLPRLLLNWQARPAEPACPPTPAAHRPSRPPPPRRSGRPKLMRWLVDGQAFHEQRLDQMWNVSAGGLASDGPWGGVPLALGEESCWWVGAARSAWARCGTCRRVRSSTGCGIGSSQSQPDTPLPAAAAA